jgi:hypothetical protein
MVARLFPTSLPPSPRWCNEGCHHSFPAASRRKGSKGQGPSSGIRGKPRPPVPSSLLRGRARPGPFLRYSAAPFSRRRPPPVKTLLP